MRGGRPITVLALGAAIALAGCGGDDRQDAEEPEGTYKVEVVRQEFPATQRLAQRNEFTIAVRNADTRPIPNVAVTVDAFTTRDDQEGLADPTRPVWIVNTGPTGGDTAYVNTWALGELPAGATKTFTWDVTPVLPGRHTVDFRVAAGLHGKAVAEAADGGAPSGRFVVEVDREPAQARVADDGSVERDGE